MTTLYFSQSFSQTNQNSMTEAFDSGTYENLNIKLIFLIKYFPQFKNLTIFKIYK